VTEPKTISEWVRYLVETNNFDTYDGCCTCYRCKEIKDGFAAWKAAQAGEAKPLNDPSDRAGRKQIKCPNKKAL
jgi:hypothetical protein